MARELDLLAAYLESLPRRRLRLYVLQQGERLECYLTPYVLFAQGGVQTRGVLLECVERYRAFYHGDQCNERVAVTEAGAKAVLLYLAQRLELAN